MSQQRRRGYVGPTPTAMIHRSEKCARHRILGRIREVRYTRSEAYPKTVGVIHLPASLENAERLFCGSCFAGVRGGHRPAVEPRVPSPAGRPAKKNDELDERSVLELLVELTLSDEELR